MVNTSTNVNLQTLRAQQVKGFVQFQDLTTPSQYWRLKDRQTMTIGYNFGRVEHYQDDGTKARDWAGYNHTFTMKLKITSDMFSTNYPFTAPTSADKNTINYWIYQNIPDPGNNHAPTPFNIIFVTTHLTLDTTNPWILHTFTLDPTSFSDITWDATAGAQEITISGEIVSVASIQRQSTDVTGVNTTWHSGQFVNLLDQVRKRKLILTHIKHNYRDFLIDKAKTLANQIILDEISNRMRQANFSPKIIERTYIKEVKFIDAETLRINIVSDFTSDSNFDVSLARELGTDNNKPDHKHWIRPKTKLVLSWLFQGKRLFSSGHRVTGFQSLHIIEKTINEKKPVLIDALKKELFKWKKSLK